MHRRHRAQSQSCAARPRIGGLEEAQAERARRRALHQIRIQSRARTPHPLEGGQQGRGTGVGLRPGRSVVVGQTMRGAVGVNPSLDRVGRRGLRHQFECHGILCRQ